MPIAHRRLTEPAPQIFSTSDTSRSDGRTRIAVDVDRHAQMCRVLLVR